MARPRPAASAISLISRLQYNGGFVLSAPPISNKKRDGGPNLPRSEWHPLHEDEPFLRRKPLEANRRAQRQTSLARVRQYNAPNAHPPEPPRVRWSCCPNRTCILLSLCRTRPTLLSLEKCATKAPSPNWRPMPKSGRNI